MACCCCVDGGVAVLSMSVSMWHGDGGLALYGVWVYEGELEGGLDLSLFDQFSTSWRKI